MRSPDRAHRPDRAHCQLVSATVETTTGPAPPSQIHPTGPVHRLDQLLDLYNPRKRQSLSRSGDCAKSILDRQSRAAAIVLALIAPLCVWHAVVETENCIVEIEPLELHRNV